MGIFQRNHIKSLTPCAGLRCTLHNGTIAIINSLRIALFASSFLFFSHFPETSFSATGEARRPNFIIFFTDDQGYGDVGSFGSPNIRTPNLDRLAAEGVKFRSFYAQQVCGPSRAALLTGSYPIRVAEPENRKNPNTTLLKGMTPNGE